LQKQVLGTSAECWQKNDLLQHLPQLSPGTPFPQNSPLGMQDLFAVLDSPKQANAIPARPNPNPLKACRRVTDWATPFAS